MKYFVILFGCLILIGFTGITFADPFDLTILSPIQQYKNHQDPRFVFCDQHLISIVKIDGKYGCVTKDTSFKLIERGWAKCENQIGIWISSCEIKGEQSLKFLTQIQVTEDDKTYVVPFQISNGILKDILFDKSSNSLKISMNATDDGRLKISIPRELLDAKQSYCPIDPKRPDNLFFVLRDGEEIESQEIQSTDTTRTLDVRFLKTTTKIEVIAVCWA
ncbi:MAG: hypothetical protein K8Q89_05620 [Nitrosarchaeum sp.]|nr:hypothetical protein [Nitrosarchaeum sp.]